MTSLYDQLANAITKFDTKVNYVRAELVGSGISSWINTSGPPSSEDGVDGQYCTDTVNNKAYGPKTSGAWGSPLVFGGGGSSWLSGNGAPSSGLGVNGNFYLDETTPAIYGPKTGGSWGTGIIIPNVSNTTIINSAIGTSQGNVPKLIRIDNLPTGIYAAPVAYFGVLNGVGTVNLSLVEPSGTVILSIGTTSSTPASVTAGSGFTLATTKTAILQLTGSASTTIGYIGGYNLHN